MNFEAVRLFVPLALIGATACTGNWGDSSPGASLLPQIALTPVGTAEIGSGMISPFKLVRRPGTSNSMLVVTGRGETFSEGRLHLVDADSLTDLREPLDIGINGSDLLASEDRAVVVSRGAQMASLVDLVNWRVLHQFVLGFNAGSIAWLADGDVVVASADSGQVAVLSTVGDQIAVKRHVNLGTRASDIVPDLYGNRIYVVQPLRGVDVLNARDLSRQGNIDLPGEPGRGATLWNDHLLVSNRDGYLHVIDRQTESVQTIDLAIELGLDRSQLPKRAIDPGEIVVLDPERLVVVNGRRASIMFVATPAADSPLRAIALVPSGQSMVHFDDGRRLLTTQPSANRIMITTVVESPLPGSILPSTGHVTGTEITYWSVLPRGTRSVAAFDSAGSIRIVDDQARVTAMFSAPRGSLWRGPFAATDIGFAIVGTNGTGTSVLFITDQMGTVLLTMPILIGDVFSLATHDHEVAAVGRLGGTMQLFDLDSGTTRVIALGRDRPRVAIGLANAWAIAHDTNPDIGVSLVRNDQVEHFESFTDWITGLVRIDTSHALAVTFHGRIGTLDDDGRLRKTRNSGLESISDARSGHSETIWVTSESLGVSYKLRAGDYLPVGRHDAGGIRSLLAFPEGDCRALVFARAIVVGR